MSEISKIYNALNAIPVDRLAASMFWKTPWWAEVPEHVATLIARAVLEERLQPEVINVDYFKEPPKRSTQENRNQEIPDRRGWYVRFESGRQGVITGYAYSTVAIRNTSPKDKKKTSKPFWWRGDGWDNARVKHKNVYNHRWWVFGNGRFEIIQQSKHSKRMSPIPSAS